MSRPINTSLLSSPYCTGPNFSLMPYFIIMPLVIDVALSISLLAPVVTSLSTSSSAARPPRKLIISSLISPFVTYILSSPGSGIVYPPAIPVGIIETL